MKIKNKIVSMLLLLVAHVPVPGLCDEALQDMAAPRTKRSDTLRLDDKQYIRLPFQRRVSNKFVHNFVGKRGDATPEFSSKLAELERSAAARQAMEELAVRRLLLSQNSGNNDLGVAESVVLADIIGRRLQELAQTADEQGLQSIPLSLEARAHPGYSHAFVGKRENDQGSFGGLAAQPASWKTFGDEFSRVDLIPADALLLDSDGEAGPDDGVRFLNNPSVTDDNKFDLLSNGEGSFLNKRSIPIYDFDTLNSELGGSIRKLDKSFARRSQSKFGHAFVGKRGPGFNHAFVGKRQSYGHSFVGKRQTYGHSFVGKRQTYGHSFIGKRQVFGHSFVGKRQKFGHSFIGKRNNKETSRVKRSSATTSSDEDKRVGGLSDSYRYSPLLADNTKRGPEFSHAFVGKRDPGFSHAFVGKRDPGFSHAFVGKRDPGFSHAFVGKRDPGFSHAFVGKRDPGFSHAFVGKRDPGFSHAFVGKRDPGFSHAFVGKRDPGFSHAFVGKRDPGFSHAFVGKRDPGFSHAFVGKRDPGFSHAFVGKRDPGFSHAFVGKRDPGFSHAFVGKRDPGFSHAFVGKRDPGFSHAFVGKRDPGFSHAFVSKRDPGFSHAFVGKRDPGFSHAFVGKRDPGFSHAFVGKRDPGFSHAFVGKRDPEFSHAFVGKRDPGFSHAFVGKRDPGFSHAFVGKRDPGFSHAFVGKRDPGFSHAFVGKRDPGFSHAFVGKRDGNEGDSASDEGLYLSSDVQAASEGIGPAQEELLKALEQGIEATQLSLSVHSDPTDANGEDANTAIGERVGVSSEANAPNGTDGKNVVLQEQKPEKTADDNADTGNTSLKT